MANKVAENIESKIRDRIESVIREALRDNDRRFGQEHSYFDFDYEDESIRAKIRRVALFRDVTLIDLEKLLIEWQAEYLATIHREGEFSRACHERRDDLKVFTVYNTADRPLRILAKDASCARHLAFYASHIKDKNNGRVMVMRPEHEAELRNSGKALGRALREGRPGVVKQVGENVVIEDAGKVFTPFSIVGD